MRKVSVLSQDDRICEAASQALKPECLVKCFSQADKFFDHIRERSTDLVLIDNDADNQKGLEYYRTVKTLLPRIKVIMISALQDVSHAVLATKLGVSDYLNKPLDAEKLSEAANRIFASLSEINSVSIPDQQRAYWSGTSRALNDFLSLIGEAASSEKDILLISEPGMPSSPVAELVHQNSQASKKDMIPLDLSSFEKEHSESMFWNSLKQMTGESSKPHDEVFQLPGAIYMQRIGGLPEHFRSSIFDYFLKERIHGSLPRIIINIDLSEGISREDMDRLKGVLLEVRIPSLRDRKEDLPAILAAFMKESCGRYGKRVHSVSNEVLDFLFSYDWPGNYEELRSVIDNSVLRCKSGCIMPCDAPVDLQMLLSFGLRKAVSNNDHYLVSAQNIFKRELVSLLSECSGRDMEAVSKFLDVPRSAVSDL